MNRTAFSLVELSIVLVILGLLVGGILAGQSLIRASELRAVGTEYQRHVTAIHAFRDKYFAIPGDMSNATSIWGKDTVNCNSHSGNAGTPGTCNGNASGVIDGAFSPSTTGEMFQFWTQLSLAGLIPGTYSGIANASGNVGTTPGVNSPISKLANAGWGVYNMGIFAGASWAFAGNYGNSMVLGVGGGGSIPNSSALRPEEAWNIDTKLDDGMPAQGKIWGGIWASCTTASSATDTSGQYKLNNNVIACPLYFPRAF